ncbi:unnamed protein product [Candida verbasci]|uniref:Vacuolar protein sorting 55 n=1 Tax=Candida verbasci TaxID=1227364 RepID=A0A9W4XEZ0_9ASCO|nr:unnamed protein product [Candida verbasci]
MNPLNKIIFLSAFLASGFLLILLSCALFNNYKPLWVIFIFLIAPLPNLIANSIENARDYNFLTFNDYNNQSNSQFNQSPLQEFCKFLTGLLIISGISLPLTFYHCGLIQFGSMLMSIIGGLIVYGDIIIFIWFFSNEEEENDEFNF